MLTKTKADVGTYLYATKTGGENPAAKAGNMGKEKCGEVLVWTKDEYLQFIETLKDKPASYFTLQNPFNVLRAKILLLHPKPRKVSVVSSCRTSMQIK